MRKERIEDHYKAMQREEKRKIAEAEVHKWEMLNRYKTDECIKEYDKNKNLKNWDKIVKYRQELQTQMLERNENEKMEREEDIAEFEKSLKAIMDDDQFFSYAEEVLQIAKDRKRPTYPIERVIEVSF